MVPITATASVLLVSALWTPTATVSDPVPDGSVIIQVEVPARTSAPVPQPADGPPDDSAPGVLPATGGELALWGGALALVAIGAGAALRARHREV